MFKSILGHFPHKEQAAAISSTLTDLELGRIFSAIENSFGSLPESVQRLYRQPLTDRNEIAYRQEIMRDIIEGNLYPGLFSFVQKIKKALSAKETAKKTYYRPKGECTFLEGAYCFVEAIEELIAFLQNRSLQSDGMKNFLDYLEKYSSGPHFTGLKRASGETKNSLTALSYTLFIRENTIEVNLYAGQAYQSPKIKDFFQKFATSSSDAPLPKERQDDLPLNHIDEQICSCLAKLCPKPFSLLHDFYLSYHHFLPPLLFNFYLDSQFYLSYAKYMQDWQQIAFCLPQMQDEDIFCFTSGYNLSLSHEDAAAIVANDFSLGEDEKIAIVTGPNQGGKTTFLRLIGQIAYLASLGLFVPAKSAAVPCFDAIYTHFESREDKDALNGCLQDDLVRIHSILESATKKSLILINEMFSTTALEDALILGKKILQKLDERQCRTIYVTFCKALSHFNEKTVSLVSQTDGESRTYKISRQAADGKAHALSAAQKYALSHDDILRRIKNGRSSSL